jgi:predicted NAD/FAD-binding protein
MSFSVSCARTGLEYAGSSLDTFYAQRQNLLRLRFHRLLLDIVRFNYGAKRLLRRPHQADLRVSELCRELRLSEEFISYYLAPMLSAIWSAAPAEVHDFPAAHFLRFFSNHGLLNLRHRPTWRVVSGGSRSYVEPLSAPYRDRIRLKTPVRSIDRSAQGVRVTDYGGHHDHFDEVVLAVHSDQALKLLSTPDEAERQILGAIRYQPNEVVLHTDTRLLPRNRRAWASWNYRMPMVPCRSATLTYNMNRLQGIDAPETFCVTLNQTGEIAPSRVLGKFIYDHPLLNEGALAAQRRFHEINGRNRTHYAGAYWGYGFHEDGVRSALAACAPLTSRTI